MDPKVSIVVPVWNRADLTQTFLKSHWQMVAKEDTWELIVVDNGSTDPTPLLLEQWAEVYEDKLVVVKHATNQGFSAGHNAGYAVSRGNILVFISNDVIVQGDYIAKIVERLEREQEPVLLGEHMHVENTGWNTFRGVLHSDGRKWWDEAETIPYLAGHLVAAKRDTWELLGGWDERYTPADYEDIDLSYNAITKGVKLLAISLPVEHLFGQSASQLPGGRITHTRNSRKLFMQKWELGRADG